MNQTLLAPRDLNAENLKPQLLPDFQPFVLMPNSAKT